MLPVAPPRALTGPPSQVLDPLPFPLECLDAGHPCQPTSPGHPPLISQERGSVSRAVPHQRRASPRSSTRGCCRPFACIPSTAVAACPTCQKAATMSLTRPSCPLQPEWMAHPTPSCSPPLRTAPLAQLTTTSLTYSPFQRLPMKTFSHSPLRLWTATLGRALRMGQSH